MTRHQIAMGGVIIIFASELAVIPCLIFLGPAAAIWPCGCIIVGLGTFAIGL